LKQSAIDNKGRIKNVAPFTGAWIETGNYPDRQRHHADVAPFTGAWIETANCLSGLARH